MQLIKLFSKIQIILIIGTLFLLQSATSYANQITPSKKENTNKYGIAGIVNREQLILVGLPEDTDSYNWNWLHPDQKYNMVRPYKYWEEHGGVHPGQYWGWNDVLGQIGRNPEDRNLFAQYLQENPGKTWIIGNEPDVSYQDNLSPMDYARMFHDYYIFISAFDPSAKFAVAATLGRIDTADWNHHNLQTHVYPYYCEMLNWYRIMYPWLGEMPIDVWNTHIYSWDNNPDSQVAEDYMYSFHHMVNTFADGTYAGSDTIVTEFALNSSNFTQTNSIEYMRNMTAKLEQSDFDEWFWYVSTAPNGSYDENTRLYDENWVPTPLAWEYANLAIHGSNWGERLK